jgi:hypothetical protein
MKMAPGEPACVGLYAKEFIPDQQWILQTASNAAVDAPYDFDSEDANISERLKLSVVTPWKGMFNDERSRIMLGPLRFVNHDCVPNSQVPSTVSSLNSMSING